MSPVAAPLYPVNLVVSGRRCLVVGGGRVAARKIDGLLAGDAIVHVVAPSILDSIKARPALTWEERPYRSGEVGDYRLVMTATDDDVVNQQVFADGEAAGVWVNSADDPANCSFTLPAVVRRGPLVLTVSTGGHSPALASWLRARLEREFGPEYESLIEILSAEREALHAAGRSTEGLDWISALDSDMLDLVRSGRVTEARERLRACLSSS
jgi:precorrin-2 dehydrogenase/sirohydrochlorin ferrochelatase